MSNEIFRIEHLGKVFNGSAGRIVALDDINLSIHEGDIFGIIGLSGAGKSTLVRCLNLLETPTSGKVIFNGKELMGMGKKELLKTRQSIGMIFQDFNLMAQRNALKNVLYPMEIGRVPKAQAVKRARELLELVGLKDRMKSYPSQLSGGQKQRVAIARALAMDPKVLLCDEATSALDPNTTRQILDLLKKINRELGVTIVVITHEMKVIETICNRVAVLDHSNVVEEGMVRDVFINPQSKIARQLIMPGSDTTQEFSDSNCLRIIFDGYTSYEPVISNLALECKAAVNILYANTKNINGIAMGQMLLQLPQDETTVLRVKQWLKDRNITFKEETLNVFGTNDQ
ncbi:MAG: ATP-binding cassette domain-containing protein [Clostridia bacterium]|nr:ATP-binding cassette domain-containing protein [Clostridia bacterium]